jgi:hypothetical protein
MYRNWLASGVLIVTSAACFGIVAYNVASAGDPPRVTALMVVAAVAAGFLILGLFLPSARRMNLALCVTSVVLATYVVEAVLAALDQNAHKSIIVGWPQPDRRIMMRTPQARVRIARTFGVDYDSRSVFEVVTELRKTRRDVQPAMFPVNVNVATDRGGALQPAISIGDQGVLPLGGIANSLTVLCNEGGTYVTYESDEYGFNNPKGLWRPGSVDIAALGDSFTHGMCVSPQENFVARIRSRYPKTLNLGMAGSGPLLMLGELQEYLTILKPRVVLWVFVEGNDEPSGNDLIDLRAERNSPILMRYFWNDEFRQGLLSRQNEIDRALESYITQVTARGPSLAQQIALLYNIRAALAARLLGSRSDAYSDIELELFEQIILRARTAVKRWGGELYFVYLPDFSRYANSPSAPPNQGRHRILSFLRATGLPVIDVHEAFAQQQDPLDFFPFRIRGHYNERGHEVVAEAILQSLLRRGPNEIGRQR